MMDKIANAIAWMDREKAGYKRASKKFGVPVDVLRDAKRGESEDVRPEVPESAPDTPLTWTAARSVLAAPNSAMICRNLAGVAADSLKEFGPGGRVVGLTGGQFSLLDLIRAALAVTGPADVTLSTWTAGIRDAETAAWLLAGGQIRSLRILTDRSFPVRQPKYCERILELFGPGAIVVTRTHAKFATIRNSSWNVAIRSSMNLNKNKRWEQFDIDDDADICRLFEGFAEEVALQVGPGLMDIPTPHVDEAFDKVVAAEALVRQRLHREKEHAERKKISELPALERARRILNDTQSSLEEAQASGDHGLVSRLVIPLLKAEERFGVVAGEHGEAVSVEDGRAWVRKHVFPLLTDEQLEALRGL